MAMIRLIIKYSLGLLILPAILAVISTLDIVKSSYPNLLSVIPFLLLIVVTLTLLSMLHSFWVVITQPPGEGSWRFNGELPPKFTFFGAPNESSARIREKWLKKKLRYAVGRKKLQFEKELKILTEKFDLVGLRAVEEAFQEVELDNLIKKRNRKKFGTPLPKIECPFCHTVGNVGRLDNVKSFERTREEGYVGAVIGRKTVTEKTTSQMHCKNCSATWNP